MKLTLRKTKKRQPGIRLLLMGKHRNRDGPVIYHRSDGPRWYQFIGCAGPPDGTGPPVKDEYG